MKNKNIFILVTFLILFIAVMGVVAFKKYKYPPQTADVVRDRAWEVFAKYLQFAKDHNREGIKSLSHQVSPQCQDLVREAECFALMDNVYEFFSKYKAADFTQVWSDEKQIILLTDPVQIDTEGVRWFAQAHIIFIRQENEIKVLGGNPARMWLQNTKDLSEQEIMDRLEYAMKDSDQDGLEDQKETATDPTKRDSDGDGWWDGVEILFKE